MPTICILYGFGEGPKIGKRFKRVLKNKGYEIVTNPARADIIFTHSAGCLLLPKKLRARQVIQVGPHWPERLWPVAATRKLISDFRVHHQTNDLSFWWYKSMWNLIYFCRIATNLRFLYGVKEGRQWRHGEITTVVRPRFDAFCAPRPTLRFKEAPACLSFPGYHDDCWRDPAPYIALIKS